MRGWRIKEKLAAHWPLQSAAGVITPDVSGHGYDGTLVNVPTWGVGPFGGLQCIELNGLTQHVNVGDVTQLNAVEQLTICFWTWQNILDALDVFLDKFASGNDYLQWFTTATGSLNVRIYVGGVVGEARIADYSLVIRANNWHHIAIVFDGSQVGNASRLVIYVDGIPITLAFTGTMPAATPDTAGTDMTIGHTGVSWDGRFWDWRLLTVAATRDEVNQIIRSPVPYLV